MSRVGNTARGRGERISAPRVMISESAQLPQRIVSFLPSATEMICAFGLSERLVGVTHECDYPPEVQSRPVVVRSALHLEGLRSDEIDRAVAERLRNGGSLYEVDERLLRDLDPDLIVTQDLCQVCAPSGNEVSQVLRSLDRKPRILWMTPTSIDGIFANIRELGEVTGRPREAERLIREGRARIQAIRAKTEGLPSRPRVFCMEWIDPVYCSGHWVPEMVDIAGGVDGLGRKGTDSARIPWSEVREWAPEVLIVSPCGYHLPEAVLEAPRLFAYPGFADLPAVRTGRLHAVDASSYFARPGLRVIEGIELLAHLIHPDTFPWRGPAGACRPIATLR